MTETNLQGRRLLEANEFCAFRDSNSASRVFPSFETERAYRLGEMFSGAGGMALGAHMATVRGNGFCHAWVNDMDRDACKTLKLNLPIDPENVHCADIEKINIESLPCIDGLVFGFPCNDFSLVGDRHGIAGRYGGLYRWGIRGLEIKKPLFFVAENVSGLSASGNDLEIISNEMEKSGYDVFEKIYKFEEYGVPQTRHRIIIVGFRKDLDVHDFEHPEPTTRGNPISCKQALIGIGINTTNNEATKHSATVVERLKHIRPGENAFTADLPESLKLSMKSGATISQIYKRLKADEPAYTVTGSGGGGTHVYHWKEHRSLTNRERARLQTFPDDFVFSGGKESVRRQIGMAVPPEGARMIFLAVLETLLERRIGSQC